MEIVVQIIFTIMQKSSYFLVNIYIAVYALDIKCGMDYGNRLK